MNTLKIITQILLIVGGLNWGLVGLFSFDLVVAIFGEMSFLSRVVYTLVGISSVYQLVVIKSFFVKSEIREGIPSYKTK